MSFLPGSACIDSSVYSGPKGGRIKHFCRPFHRTSVGIECSALKDRAVAAQLRRATLRPLQIPPCRPVGRH